jgi:hypothetical protein
MSLVVLWAHRANFVRLWRHKEPRVTFPWNQRKPSFPAGGPEGRDAGSNQGPPR